MFGNVADNDGSCTGACANNYAKELKSERNLLRYYAEGEQVVSGLQRTPAHRHLLGIGYIQEPSG